MDPFKVLLMLEQKFNYGVAPDGRFNPTGNKAQRQQELPLQEP